MTPVRFELTALRSRIKHSTTEPLCSLPNVKVNKDNGNSEHIVEISTFGEGKNKSISWEGPHIDLKFKTGGIG